MVFGGYRGLVARGISLDSGVLIAIGVYLAVVDISSRLDNGLVVAIGDMFEINMTVYTAGYQAFDSDW